MALLPKDWKPASWDVLGDKPAVFALRADETKTLADELKQVTAALAKARELETHPFGRHRVEYAPNFIGTLVADQATVRPIAGLLEMDVYDAVQRGDMTRAWHSQRALLNCGRSLGDEPFLITGLVRVAVDGAAVHSVEHALAQGEMVPCIWKIGSRRSPRRWASRCS